MINSIVFLASHTRSQQLFSPNFQRKNIEYYNAMNLNLKNHQDKKVNKEFEKNKIGSFMFLSLV